MKNFPTRAPMVAATNEQRAVYSAIKRQLKGNDKAIITPGYLRLEAQLGSSSRYDFKVLENQGTAFACEQRLKLSDAFFVTHVGVYIRKDVASSPNGSGEPQSWASPLVFTTTELLPAATIMNTGKLRVEVDGVVYIQGMDLLRFRKVGQAQMGLVQATGATAYPASEWSTGEVFQAATPVFRLNGGSSNEVSVLLGQSVNATAVSGTNFLSVHFHGFLAQNAGQFNPNTR
jgi:hypothetical protein